MIGLSSLINAFLPQRAATVQQLGHPAAGVIGWFNPEDNTSGVAVTEDTALTYAGWWCGVRILSETVASLPCILYRRRGDNDKERAREDRRYSLVHDAPNEEMSSYTFFETSTAHIISWGNAYSKAIRNGMNDPMSLELRLPDRVTPRRRREDNQIVYDCTDPSETVERPDMLHVPGLGYDGLVGYSIIRKAAQSLGAVIAADKYAGSFFKNGAIPSGVLSVPERLKKDAREHLRREWDDIHGTAARANRVAIVHGGMTYQPIAMNNHDAQFLESRQFSISEIARWLRLPPHMLADLKNSTVRANIEQQAIEFIVYSLTPWLRRWETNLSRTLLRQNERGSMFFEFLLEGLLRGDIASRYAAYAQGRQWGWINVNEIRRMENMNAIGPDGDVYLQPLNMAPAGTPPVQPKAASAELPTSLQREFQRSLKAAVNKILSRGKLVKAEIQSGLATAIEAISDAETHLSEELSTHRETMAGVREDIAGIGQAVAVTVPAAVDEICGRHAVATQLAVTVDVRQCVEEASSFKQQTSRQLAIVRQAARDQLAEAFRVLLQQEAGQAAKAARRQVHEAKPFLAWVDEYYSERSTSVRQRLERPVGILAQVTGTAIDVDAVTAGHVERSRDELLGVADGDPEGFEQRVEACVTGWVTDRIDEDIETICTSDRN